MNSSVPDVENDSLVWICWRLSWLCNFCASWVTNAQNSLRLPGFLSKRWNAFGIIMLFWWLSSPASFSETWRLTCTLAPSPSLARDPFPFSAGWAGWWWWRNAWHGPCTSTGRNAARPDWCAQDSARFPLPPWLLVQLTRSQQLLWNFFCKSTKWTNAPTELSFFFFFQNFFSLSAISYSFCLSPSNA